jgi:hypothetical protein
MQLTLLDQVHLVHQAVLPATHLQQEAPSRALEQHLDRQAQGALVPTHRQSSQSPPSIALLGLRAISHRL